MTLSNSQPTTSLASSTTAVLSSGTPLAQKRDHETKSRLVFRNRVIDKKGLRNLIAWAYKEFGTSATTAIADELKDLGFHYATQAAVSISVDDLRIPEEKKELLNEAEEEITRTEERYRLGEITEVERHTKVIDTWTETNERLVEAVKRTFTQNDPLNSVWMMANSGARGNMSQVRQLVGMRGLMANPQGEIIDLPIRTNFREGLTVTEYVISSYGARKGLVDTALRTADSGYLTRRLVDVAQDMIVRDEDCGTQRGIVINADEKGSYQSKLVGRLTAEDIKQLVKVAHVVILGGTLQLCKDKAVLKRFDKGVLVQPGDELQGELKSSSLALVQAVKTREGSALLVSELPQKTWRIEPEASLKVADGNWVEAETMLTEEIVSPNKGLVVVSENNGISYISLLEGSLHVCEDKKTLKRFEKGLLIRPKDTLAKNLTVNQYTYVRSTVSDQDNALFLSEFAPQNDYTINTNTLLVKKNQWIERDAKLSNDVFSIMAGLISTYPIKKEKEELLWPRNTEISLEISKQLEKRQIKAVKVRSPLTCETPKSVCRHCYGWALAHNKLVDLGEAVGIVAAQSIGEPGTQLTMRTFHTGGVSTAETGTVRSTLAGTVSLGGQARVRPYRTPHGVNAYIAETDFQLSVRSTSGEKQAVSITSGSVLFAEDGSAVKRDDVLGQITGGNVKKSVEKATKDVICDLAGQVKYDKEIQPREATDRQGNVTVKAQRLGQLWVLSGDVYNLPPNAEPVVEAGCAVQAGDVLAESRLRSEYGGDVRLRDATGDSREVQIVTAKLTIKDLKLVHESSHVGELWNLETEDGLSYRLHTSPGSKIGHGEVIAELSDERFRTQSGGLVKFSPGLSIKKARSAKHGFELSRGGTLLWIPQETHEINKDISLLMVKNHQRIEAGTEVVKDIFSQTSGIVTVIQKNDILREITVRSGNVYYCDVNNYSHREALERFSEEGMLVNPGDVLIENELIAENIHYVESVVDPSEGSPFLLLRPVEEFAIPDDAYVPAIIQVKQPKGPSMTLKAQQRLMFKDGELVKSVEPVELLRTQIILETSDTTPQMTVDVEVVLGRTKKSRRLSMVILESLLVRRDTLSDATHGSTHTELKIEDGKRVKPGQVIATTQILCKEDGVVQIPPLEARINKPGDTTLEKDTVIELSKIEELNREVKNRGKKPAEFEAEPVRRLIVERESDACNIVVPDETSVNVKPGEHLVQGDNLVKHQEDLSDCQVKIRSGNVYFCQDKHAHEPFRKGQLVYPWQPITEDLRTDALACVEAVETPEGPALLISPFDQQQTCPIHASTQQVHRHGQWVDKGTELVATSSRVRGLAKVTKNPHSQTVSIRSGQLIPCTNKNTLECFQQGQLVIEGCALDEDIILDTLTFVESVDGPEGAMLLLSPVQEFTIPQEACELSETNYNGQLYLCQDKQILDFFQGGLLSDTGNEMLIQGVTAVSDKEKLRMFVESLADPSGEQCSHSQLLKGDFTKESVSRLREICEENNLPKSSDLRKQLLIQCLKDSGVSEKIAPLQNQELISSNDEQLDNKQRYFLEDYEHHLEQQSKPQLQNYLQKFGDLKGDDSSKQNLLHAIKSKIKKFIDAAVVTVAPLVFFQSPTLANDIQIKTALAGTVEVISYPERKAFDQWSEEELEQLCRENNLLPSEAEEYCFLLDQAGVQPKPRTLDTLDKDELAQLIRELRPSAVYVEIVDTPEGSALLLSPIQVEKFAVPEETYQFSSKDILTVADGQWIEPGTRLTEAPITSQREGVAVLTDKSITILSGEQHLCDSQSILKRFRKGILVNPGIVLVDGFITDALTYVQSVDTPQGSALLISPLSQDVYQTNRTQTPLQVQQGQYVKRGDMVAPGLKTKRSGIVVIGEVHATSPTSGVVEAIRPGWLRLRIGRPYMVSPESILHVRDGGLVQRGDALALLVFERAKTGDIVQGLPRIEELLEARRPRDASVLCQSSGHVKLEIGDDEEVLVKVVEDQQGDGSYDIPADHSMFGGATKARKPAPWDEDQYKTALLGVGELSSMMVKALQDLCRRHGLKGYTQWKKPELCRRLERAGVAAPPPALQDLKAEQLIELVEKLDPSGVQWAELLPQVVGVPLEQPALKTVKKDQLVALVEKLDPSGEQRAELLPQVGVMLKQPALKTVKKDQLVALVEKLDPDQRMELLAQVGVSLKPPTLKMVKRDQLVALVKKLDPSQQKELLAEVRSDSRKQQLIQCLKDSGVSEKIVSLQNQERISSTDEQIDNKQKNSLKEYENYLEEQSESQLQDYLQKFDNLKEDYSKQTRLGLKRRLLDIAKEAAVIGSVAASVFFQSPAPVRGAQVQAAPAEAVEAVEQHSSPVKQSLDEQSEAELERRCRESGLKLPSPPKSLTLKTIKKDQLVALVEKLDPNQRTDLLAQVGVTLKQPALKTVKKDQLVALVEKLDPNQRTDLLAQVGVTLKQPALKAIKKDQLVALVEKLDPSGEQRAELLKGDVSSETSPPPQPLAQRKKSELIALIRQMEAPISTEMPAVAEPTMTEDDRVHVYDIPLGRNVMVSDGHQVQAGSALTDGPINPHDLLDIHFKDLRRRRQSTMEAAQGAIATVQQRLVDEVQSVYRSQGVTIDNKHIEVIVRQMTSKVRIEDAGDTTLLPGELVELPQVAKTNAAIAETGGMQAQFSPMLLGITKASLNTDSFISAASFQETTRVLTEAAIEGKSDLLRGLKENVIIGRLIPAGTGFDGFDDQLRDEVGPHPDILDDDQTGYRRLSSLRPDYTIEIPVPSQSAPVLDDPSDEQLRKARRRIDDTSGSAAALTRPGEHHDPGTTMFPSEVPPEERDDSTEEPEQNRQTPEENLIHDSTQAEALDTESQPMDEGFEL